MRVVFVGTGEIGIPVLEMFFSSPEHHLLAVVTQPDKPAGRRQELLPSPIKRTSVRHHVPVFQPARIRDRTAIEQIQFLRPDVIVVMAYGQILPRQILQTPSVACLNLHASLLPRHRGAAPIHAAIEAGDRESGISVMYMAEGLDTGDVLLQKKIGLSRRETAGTLHDRLARIAPDAIADALALLKRGIAPRLLQDPAQATYSPKLTRLNGRIDWTWSEVVIERHVRAMNPWPAAYTTLPGAAHPLRLKVFATIQSRKTSGTPGEVLRTDKHGILVAAGAGGVLLREVQLEGKTRMTARDFLLGHTIPAGTILGSSSDPREHDGEIS